MLAETVVPERSEVVEGLRERLGPVGVWSAMPAVPMAAEIAAARQIDTLGYGSLWTGETVGGKEAFARAAALLGHSSKIVIGTGIANIWSRQPATMEGGATTVAETWPGRFVLGVGVSHASFVEPSGRSYVKPLEYMSQYLAAMAAQAQQPRYLVARSPLILAALRPRMLALARDQADGALPYFVPPSHVPRARAILGPDRLLIPEQAIMLCTDHDKARRAAREYMAFYLAQPNYINSLRWLGYTDDDLSGGGSNRLVDALVCWGDEQAIADRVKELRDSGADHVLLQPIGGDLANIVLQLKQLASAVLTR